MWGGWAQNLHKCPIFVQMEEDGGLGVLRVGQLRPSATKQQTRAGPPHPHLLHLHKNRTLVHCRASPPRKTSGRLSGFFQVTIRPGF